MARIEEEEQEDTGQEQDGRNKKKILRLWTDTT
jgi:hypothetical protein